MTPLLIQWRGKMMNWVEDNTQEGANPRVATQEQSWGWVLAWCRSLVGSAQPFQVKFVFGADSRFSRHTQITIHLITFERRQIPEHLQLRCYLYLQQEHPFWQQLVAVRIHRCSKIIDKKVTFNCWQSVTIVTYLSEEQHHKELSVSAPGNRFLFTWGKQFSSIQWGKTCMSSFIQRRLHHWMGESARWAPRVGFLGAQKRWTKHRRSTPTPTDKKTFQEAWR